MKTLYEINKNQDKIYINYREQQHIVANNIWFKVLITFWCEDNDDISEISFDTQYPSFCDIANTIDNFYCENLKCDGGKYDYFEITKIMSNYELSL
jgi:hypothetical protein